MVWSGWSSSSPCWYDWSDLVWSGWSGLAWLVWSGLVGRVWFGMVGLVWLVSPAGLVWSSWSGLVNEFRESLPALPHDLAGLVECLVWLVWSGLVGREVHLVGLIGPVWSGWSGLVWSVWFGLLGLVRSGLGWDRKHCCVKPDGGGNGGGRGGDISSHSISRSRHALQRRRPICPSSLSFPPPFITMALRPVPPTLEGPGGQTSR